MTDGTRGTQVGFTPPLVDWLTDKKINSRRITKWNSLLKYNFPKKLRYKGTRWGLQAAAFESFQFTVKVTTGWQWGNGATSCRPYRSYLARRTPWRAPLWNNDPHATCPVDTVWFTGNRGEEHLQLNTAEANKIPIRGLSKHYVVVPRRVYIGPSE